MAWTDEQKEKAKQMYLDGNPTPENSVELCKEIADELEQTSNGVRMVLQQFKVYVKKEAGASSESDSPTKKASTSTGAKRVSKEDSINTLKDKLRSAGKEVDDEILDKLTGKAAVYLASLF